MTLEDTQHRVRMPAARRKPPLFRGAELLQMHTANGVLVVTRGEMVIRDRGPMRSRDGVHVHQEPDYRLRNGVKKCGSGRLLVSDGEQRFHGCVLSFGAMAPGFRLPRLVS